MGAENINDKELNVLNIEIANRTPDGIRMLNIPRESLISYVELVKNKLTKGFWNEVVGKSEILFIFKFEDSIIKEYRLSVVNEQEISDLCEAFNDEPPRKAANVYKYISENKFYHDFMLENYADMINR